MRAAADAGTHMHSTRTRPSRHCLRDPIALPLRSGLHTEAIRVPVTPHNSSLL
jgi:hypothetical protein